MKKYYVIVCAFIFMSQNNIAFGNSAFKPKDFGLGVSKGIGLALNSYAGFMVGKALFKFVVGQHEIGVDAVKNGGSKVNYLWSTPIAAVFATTMGIFLFAEWNIGKSMVGSFTKAFGLDKKKEAVQSADIKNTSAV